MANGSISPLKCLTISSKALTNSSLSISYINFKYTSRMFFRAGFKNSEASLLKSNLWIEVAAINLTGRSSWNRH